MKTKVQWVIAAATAAMLLGMLTASGIAEAPRRTIETTGVAQKCLACHGSYDKIRSASEKFKTASGLAANPHQYVPHKETTVIPDCTDCHTAHPVPLEDKSKVVKPDNFNWCFSSCHHMNNFDSCNSCH